MTKIPGGFIYKIRNRHYPLLSELEKSPGVVALAFNPLTGEPGVGRSPCSRPAWHTLVPGQPKLHSKNLFRKTNKQKNPKIVKEMWDFEEFQSFAKFADSQAKYSKAWGNSIARDRTLRGG